MMESPHLHPGKLHIKDFTYTLPEENIAKFPLAERDSSKLLVCKGDVFQEDYFRNIANHISKESIIVFNSSKVIKARLHFISSSGKMIEVFCLEPSGIVDPAIALTEAGPQRWNCLVGNLKSWKEQKLCLSKKEIFLQAQIIQKFHTHVEIEFEWNNNTKSFSQILDEFGEIPIPPYLNRAGTSSDATTYQTFYADKDGSVAAPTAGLHFTERVLNALKEKHVSIQHLHLHVGAGTFKPVKSETLQGHEMHSEWMEIDKNLLESLANKKERMIFAVGTTSLRTLESIYWMGVKTHKNQNIDLHELEIKQWEAYSMQDKLISVQESLTSLLAWMKQKNMERIICKTGILIAPPYQVKMINGLLTNFHQPQSTLLLLISAVMGNNWKKAYAYALMNNFRFLSYGDAMLILL